MPGASRRLHASHVTKCRLARSSKSPLRRSRRSLSRARGWMETAGAPSVMRTREEAKRIRGLAVPTATIPTALRHPARTQAATPRCSRTSSLRFRPPPRMGTLNPAPPSAAARIVMQPPRLWRILLFPFTLPPLMLVSVAQPVILPAACQSDLLRMAAAGSSCGRCRIQTQGSHANLLFPTTSSSKSIALPAILRTTSGAWRRLAVMNSEDNVPAVSRAHEGGSTDARSLLRVIRDCSKVG